MTLQTGSFMQKTWLPLAFQFTPFIVIQVARLYYTVSDRVWFIKLLCVSVWSGSTLTLLGSMRDLVVYASGGILKACGTKYSSASIRSSSSSSSSRLWKNLLSLGLGSFIRSSPWHREHRASDIMYYAENKNLWRLCVLFIICYFILLFILLVYNTSWKFESSSEALTWMTRYRCGSLAIRLNSAASSLNLGLLSASIIQPGGTHIEQLQSAKQNTMDKQCCELSVHLKEGFGFSIGEMLTNTTELIFPLYLKQQKICLQ